jgi:transcription initiation factor TFIIA small subunit
VENRLSRATANKFDRVMTDQLRETVKTRLSLKGHLHTYRCCDDVWTFIVRDIQFKMDDGELVNAEKIKIVACNSKKTGEA